MYASNPALSLTEVLFYNLFLYRYISIWEQCFTFKKLSYVVEKKCINMRPCSFILIQSFLFLATFELQIHHKTLDSNVLGGVLSIISCSRLSRFMANSKKLPTFSHGKKHTRKDQQNPTESSALIPESYGHQSIKNNLVGPQSNLNAESCIEWHCLFRTDF